MRTFFHLRIVLTQIIFSRQSQRSQTTLLLSLDCLFGNILAQKDGLLAQHHVASQTSAGSRNQGSDWVTPKHFAFKRGGLST